jgi:cell division septum initiation protein DivIVA
MSLEVSMDILAALKQEETRLQKQLKGIQGAILALNGSHASINASTVVHKQAGRKRTMSAAARARISKATKARWAKFRAEQNKRGK